MNASIPWKNLVLRSLVILVVALAGLAPSPPASAATHNPPLDTKSYRQQAGSSVVRFESNFDGGWLNQGSFFLDSQEIAYGKNVIVPHRQLTLYAKTRVLYNGNRYDFDRWQFSGNVSVANPVSSVTSLNTWGEGQVFTYYLRQDFNLSVVPQAVEVNSGDAATLSFTISRIGTPQDTERSNLEVSLLVSGLPVGATYRLEPNIIQFTSLSSNTSITGKVYIYTANAKPGNYQLQITGSLPETNTSKATSVSLTIKAPPTKYPDLVISDFSWTPASATPGTSLSFSYIEKNIGEGDAGSHRNILGIDGVTISSDDVGPLGAGAQRTNVFPQSWVVTPGPHTIVVTADSTKLVDEGSYEREYNNSKDKILGTKIATQLTVQVTPSTVPPTGGTLLTVSGKLIRTDTGAGLGGQGIAIDAPGVTPAATTGPNGNYAYSYTTPNLVTGTPKITVSFAGDSKFEGSQAQVPIGIGQLPTSISISLSPASVQSGVTTSITVNGRLIRSDTGTGLGGKTVTVSWPTGSTPVPTRADDGSYSYTLTVDTNQNWVLGAAFTGDIAFAPSNGSAVLSIRSSPPNSQESDLIITSVWWSPSNPVAGDKVAFFYTEKNQGTVASGEFSSKLFIDGADTDISTRTALSAGQSRDRQFTFLWTATAGTHTVMVQADWAKEVAEMNEDNNTFSLAITVPKASLPMSNANAAESTHPYPNNYDQTWTVKVPGSGQVRLHFQNIEVAPGDVVLLYDADGNAVKDYSGTRADFWTPWIAGDTLRVRLRTDGSNTSFGFHADAKEGRPLPIYYDVHSREFQNALSTQGVAHLVQVRKIEWLSSIDKLKLGIPVAWKMALQARQFAKGALSLLEGNVPIFQGKSLEEIVFSAKLISEFQRVAIAVRLVDDTAIARGYVNFVVVRIDDQFDVYFVTDERWYNPVAGEVGTIQESGIPLYLGRYSAWFLPSLLKDRLPPSSLSAPASESTPQSIVSSIFQVIDDFFAQKASSLLDGRVPTVKDVFDRLDVLFQQGGAK